VFVTVTCPRSSINSLSLVSAVFLSSFIYSFEVSTYCFSLPMNSIRLWWYSSAVIAPKSDEPVLLEGASGEAFFEGGGLGIEAEG
jgi:hypothetical protein